MRIHPFTFFQKPFMLFLSILLAGSVLGAPWLRQNRASRVKRPEASFPTRPRHLRTRLPAMQERSIAASVQAGKKPAICTAAPR